MNVRTAYFVGFLGFLMFSVAYALLLIPTSTDPNWYIVRPVMVVVALILGYVLNKLAEELVA